jgi:hypothetical protein
MIRKLAIAAAAIAALGTASLTVTATPAAAKGGFGGFHHHHHGFHGGRFFGGFGLYAPIVDDCLRERVYINRFGETVVHTINVCD